ncbi:MAG: radical SAM family heme chaperone HemW [Gammaproteobacteria bacterium]
MKTLPPLSLYIHLPWCVRKCPYCDFNSYESDGGVPEYEYIAALMRDLEVDLPLVVGREVQTIFMGGGTPSLFSGAAIRELLEGVRERIAVAGNAEITMEANPGTAEAQNFAEYRDSGVNRLSMGVQSLRDDMLRRLGRIHVADEALRAYEIARRAGFTNINLDLMYALPGDDVEGALYDLRAAIALAPEHLSWYQLTMEPNTAFQRHPPPQLPGDDVIVEIEEAGRTLLEAHGYRRYEISAYAREARKCVHNLNYWRFGDYLGIGAGAHGKLTVDGNMRIERRARQRNPRMYMKLAGSAETVTIEHIDSSDQRVIEFMMNALRLPEGFFITDFQSRTGIEVRAIELQLCQARGLGLIEYDFDRVWPTARGLQYLNNLLALFDNQSTKAPVTA